MTVISSKRIVSLTMCLLWAGIGGHVWAAGPRVEIEIFQTGRVSPTVPQDWMRILSEVGFASPRIRSFRGGDRIGVSTSGRAPSLRYKVTGSLGVDGRIQLSARDVFRRGDRERLRAWLKELKEHGPGGEPEKGEFGLTAEQFALVKKDLAIVVRKSTKGQPAADVITRMAADLKHPLRVDRSARTALQQAEAVDDELQGFATGTAIAAVLRPAGLVLRPKVTSGRYEYLVAKGGVGAKAWPVGRAIQNREGDILPRLIDKQTTQQVRMPLKPAMEEMARLLDVPILWDYRGLARKKIDVASVQVEMRREKRILKRILVRLLSQVGLRYDIRQDDAGQAFLWIQPNR